MSDQPPELLKFHLDPFWLEHQKNIGEIKKAIERPQTKAGEEAWIDALNNPVFKVFNRTHPIFGSLISVLEYEQIGRRAGKEYFSGLERQRMVLKALGLLIEDSVKYPYSSNEITTYKDYQRFFGKILDRFRAVDSQIQEGVKLPNFVGSLFMIFIQEVNDLRGVENFDINTEVIRREIADYLPQLEKIERGHTLEAILDRLPSEHLDKNVEEI